MGKKDFAVTLDDVSQAASIATLISSLNTVSTYISSMQTTVALHTVQISSLSV